MVSVFDTLWFDSGYMSASVYEAFGSISHVLDPRTSAQCLVRQRIQVLVTFHFALCSLPSLAGS